MSAKLRYGRARHRVDTAFSTPPRCASDSRTVGQASLRLVVTAVLRCGKGVREVGLIMVVYVGYVVSRTLADRNLAHATARARALRSCEKRWGIAWERPVNLLFAHHSVLGLVGCYWYGLAHYAVTLLFLIWLYRRRPHHYFPARRALMLATGLALALYLALPMAPPRLLPGYIDAMQLHAGQGWWGADASAPKGMGELTNDLAAFPSMHAGWSLWVALVVTRTARSVPLRGAGWLYAALTAVVIVGTANHWILDVVGGWVVVAGSLGVVHLVGRLRRRAELRECERCRVLGADRARRADGAGPSPSPGRSG